MILKINGLPIGVIILLILYLPVELLFNQEHSIELFEVEGHQLVYILSCLGEILQVKHLVKIEGWGFGALHRAHRGGDALGSDGSGLGVFDIVLFLLLLSQRDLEGGYTFNGGLSKDLPSLDWVQGLNVYHLGFC